MAIRLVFNPEVGWMGSARSKPITPRELDVLLMCAQGVSNKEIGERLGIKYQSVKNTLYRLSKKLGARNSTHALFLALDAGLLKVEIVTDDLDLELSPERRERARAKMKEELEKVGKMSKEEFDIYVDELEASRWERRKKRW